MKTCFRILLALLLSVQVKAATASVQANTTTGVITAPSNFFTGNSSAINGVVSASLIASGTLPVARLPQFSGGNVASSGAGTVALNFDPTLFTGNFSLWDATQSSRTWTANLSGLTDPIWTFSNNSADLTQGVLKYGGNAVGTSANHLGFFAATTSAQLFGMISDEVGATSGALIRVGGTPQDGYVAKFNSADSTVTWQSSGVGGVVGPGTVTENSIAIFSDTTGNLLGKVTLGSDLTYLGVNGSVPSFGGINAIAITAGTIDPARISGDYTVGTLTATAVIVTGTGESTFPLSDGAMSADDTYSGLVRTGLNNSGGVTQWDTVYLNGSSQWVLADANGSGTYPCRGIAVATVATANATTIITRGTIRNDAWTWTPGGNIYLSATAGGLTQTPPSTTGDKVQVLGYALDADTMAVEISPDYGTSP